MHHVGELLSTSRSRSKATSSRRRHSRAYFDCLYACFVCHDQLILLLLIWRTRGNQQSINSKWGQPEVTGQKCQTRSLDCLSRDVYLASSRAASISMLMTGGFAVWIDYHCIVDHAKVVSMEAEIPNPSMYPLYPFCQCKREPAVRLDCRPALRIASIQNIASSPISADKQAHGNVVDHRCLSGGTD